MILVVVFAKPTMIRQLPRPFVTCEITKSLDLDDWPVRNVHRSIDNALIHYDMLEWHKSKEKYEKGSWISFFISITMLFRTDNIMHNILYIQSR